MNTIAEADDLPPDRRAAGSRRGRGGHGRRDVGAGSMLSLVLLLLGFFALLTAMTERNDARASAVLASLSVTFGPVLGEVGGGVPYSSSLGEALALAAIDTVVRRAFKTIAEVSDITLDEEGRIAEVRMPGAALFVGDSPVARAQATRIVETMARALAGSPDGVRVGVAVRAGSNRTSPASVATAHRRALALAAGLIERGVDPVLVTVGNDPALGGDLAFAFAWRPADGVIAP